MIERRRSTRPADKVDIRRADGARPQGGIGYKLALDPRQVRPAVATSIALPLSGRWAALATVAVIASMSVRDARAQTARPESSHVLTVDGKRMDVVRFDARSRDFTFALRRPSPTSPETRVQVQDDLTPWQVKVRPTGDLPVFCGQSFARHRLVRPGQIVPSSLASGILNYDPERVLIRPRLALSCSNRLKVCAFLGAHRGYSFSFRLPAENACRFSEYQQRSTQIIDAWIAYLDRQGQ